MMEKLLNWSFYFRELKGRLKRAPNALPYGQGSESPVVRFSPKEASEYRLIQLYLTDLESREKISWFSYSVTAEQNVRVTVKPAHTVPGDIQEELRGLG